MTEFSNKQSRIRELLDVQGLDGLVLQRAGSFAWATCGAADYVNTASSYGAATLLVTRKGHHLITNNIEAPRLENEEKLKYQGWTFHVTPWHSEQSPLTDLTKGMKLGADSPYSGAKDLDNEVAHLRANLTPEEGVRFRVLGRLCAEAMDHAIQSVRPGVTEHEIAAHLAMENRSRGVHTIVNLVATDERIYAFRHPLPTYKSLERYAMLVMCGRRWGLVCSLTRLIHFGKLSDDLRRRSEAAARVDAAFIHATRPGKTIGQVFQQGVSAYAQAGYGDEWKLHHQGGPAGYEPREFIARVSSPEIVTMGQSFAWNPSITGTKVEDTIQIGEEVNEVLTTISGWPMIEVEIEGRTYARPAILEQ
jgi:antitoxin VapB